MAIVNGSLQEGYKDAAWFAANPTLVLLVGQKVNLEQTGTYKLGDGTTQLSALSFLGGSGSGLSGLTTNKVLKATSSTTAGDSQINDTSTNGYPVVDITDTGISSNFYNGVVASNVNIDDASASMSFYDGTDSQIITTNILQNKVKHSVKNTFDAPLHEFNNSVTKNGVEVATVNDIPSVAGLAPIASPTFTGTVTSPAVILSSETASTIASFDASKNIKSLDTATYPSLTELSYVKGVTSDIQTQLNSKASNLIAKQNTTITHTGTTAETKLYSALIPAGSVQANDVLKLLMKAFGSSGVASKSFRMYFNTSDAIGGVQVGINTIAATSSNVTTRNIFCKNSLSSQQVLAPTNSFAFEETVTQNSGGYSTISINFAVDQYFIVSCQLTTGTESASILGLTLQVER